MESGNTNRTRKRQPTVFAILNLLTIQQTHSHKKTFSATYGFPPCFPMPTLYTALNVERKELFINTPVFHYLEITFLYKEALGNYCHRHEDCTTGRHQSPTYCAVV